VLIQILPCDQCVNLLSQGGFQQLNMALYVSADDPRTLILYFPVIDVLFFYELMCTHLLTVMLELI
jgi:hypothetical protein